MNEQTPANCEPDPRFPSGAWTGFYLQHWMPGRHKTEVDLVWRGGIVTGDGYDRVGPYTIEGTYDTATGECRWTKQYTGKHAVTYRGVNNGRGIWGVWEIRQLGGLYVDRGGFHLWPEGTDVSEESEATEKAVLAAMEKEFAGRGSPLRPAFVAALLVTVTALLALVVVAIGVVNARRVLWFPQPLGMRTMNTKPRKWAVYVGVALIVVALAGMLLCVETVTESDETGVVRRDWRIRSRFTAPPEAPWWDDALSDTPSTNQYATTRHRIVKRHHAFGLIVTEHEIGVYRVGKPRPSHETP